MRNGRPWAVRIMPAFVCVFAAFVVGYGLGEQARLGEQDVQTVTQEVRQTGDVKRLCLTVKTGERRLVGVCPNCLNTKGDDDEPIRTPIYAARSARYTVCPECGAWLDLKRVRLEYLRSAGLMHITRTQADAARWVRENTGVSVTGKDLANWRSRGKMPSTRRIDRHYWEWNIMELLACAQDRAERDGGDV